MVSEEQAKPSADTEAELANLQAELWRRRRSERQLNAWISHLERRLHESEELLQQKASLPGNGSLKAILAQEERLRMKEELGKTRSEGLRAAAARAHADFDFHLETRFQDMCRHTVAEKCGKSDKLFKTGWVKHSQLIRVLLPLSSLRLIICSALSQPGPGAYGLAPRSAR